MTDTALYQKLTGAIEAKGVIDSLLIEMKAHLGYFFQNLRADVIYSLLQKLQQCQGTVFLSGVGKSGIIAKKISMTMSSCGTKAAYLSPLDALHGDLGVVSSGDCVLLLSKSGETEELLQLCPAFRNKGVFIVAVVSDPLSRLAKAADIVVELPVSKELCPYDLAPTTSPLVQLMFGDVLAIALMQTKQFTANDFAKNHPAGQLGRRLTLTVRDLMVGQKELPLVRPLDELSGVLVELSDKRCGCVIVVDAENHLLGIFTDGDLRRCLQKYGTNLLNMTMKDLMTAIPRFTTPEVLAFDAMKLMEQNQKSPITSLPVVEQGVVIGLIRMHDIVQSGI